MQIEPQVTLPLVYQITDPSDATAYYIRGIVADSLTGATLKTLNLTSQGGGRYTATTLAPVDPTGLGRHIDVTISVYTDPGYTVLSEIYQRTIDRYLVKHAAQSFGGGGADVDYDKIKKMLDAALKERIKEPKEADIPSVLMALEDSIGQVLRAIDGKRIPEAKETDLSPILTDLKALRTELKQAIAENRPPEPEKVDLSGIEMGLTAIKQLVDAPNDRIDEAFSTMQRLIDTITAIEKRFSKMFEDATDALSKRAGRMKDVMRSFMDEDMGEAPAPTPSPLDRFFTPHE